jgi:hypothetical protein
VDRGGSETGSRCTEVKFITEAISEVFYGAVGPEYTGQVMRIHLSEVT